MGGLPWVNVASRLHIQCITDDVVGWVDDFNPDHVRFGRGKGVRRPLVRIRRIAAIFERLF